MSTEKILLLSAISFMGSLVLTPWAKKISNKIGAIDIPGERKIHLEPITSGGGIAIFAGFLLAFLFLGNFPTEVRGFIIGAFIIVILGIWDDILDLKALPKFIIQSLAALIAIFFGVKIDMTQFLTGELAAYSFLSVPLTLLWITGITNAINIIDGLDGLAAGVTTISAFTVAAVAFMNGQPLFAVLALILGFAALGFLPHNFRSRIFMGDTGSMFLGFSLACISIMASVKLAAAFSFFVPIIILAIPIFDTLFAIARRIISGKPIYIGDRKHLHHRLLDMGLSSLQTVCLIYIFSILFGIIAIVSAAVPSRIGYYVFAASLLFIVIAGWILVYFHQKKFPSKKKEL